METELDQRIEDTIKYHFKTITAFTLTDYADMADAVNFSELVDKLTIVNIKLFKLKDAVLENKDNLEFLQKTSLEDIELCKERSRLKRCIDKKIHRMIETSPDSVEEIKLYGKN